MRDRSKEIAMLEDTLKILKQGWYEKKWQFLPEMWNAYGEELVCMIK